MTYQVQFPDLQHFLLKKGTDPNGLCLLIISTNSMIRG
ncbi:hypothetical protein BSI_12160 [Bacillus inaquosorum KCTC 13429]|uniref:Uncharacterized protein n=1 Tax=Bacillus inaquosorum KCTC 13429 TaxID=1236548 RepID=A0A9W5LK29_9BACI|nr:hypothetical protein BSI_12160 [Bacillus inaquosorum KCTC 13429]